MNQEKKKKEERSLRSPWSGRTNERTAYFEAFSPGADLELLGEYDERIQKALEQIVNHPQRGAILRAAAHAAVVNTTGINYEKADHETAQRQATQGMEAYLWVLENFDKDGNFDFNSK